MTICQCTSMNMILFVEPKFMVFDMAHCSALCIAFHYRVHWGAIHNEMNYKLSKYDRCVNVAMHITEMHNCEWALKDFKWIHNYLKTSNNSVGETFEPSKGSCCWQRPYESAPRLQITI